MSESTIITIISFLLGGGTIGALISFWANRKKTDAETDNLVIGGATALLKPLTERVTCLETDLEIERKVRKQLSAELERARRESEESSRVNSQRIVALEDSLLAKDKEIASLQFEAAELKEKVRLLEEQLEKIGKTPITKEKTEPLPRQKGYADA